MMWLSWRCTYKFLNFNEFFCSTCKIKNAFVSNFPNENSVRIKNGLKLNSLSQLQLRRCFSFAFLHHDARPAFLRVFTAVNSACVETPCTVALFSRIAASKLRRDLPARRTQGYKAFANDMIRELFRVPHPRHIRASARLQGPKITIPKNLTFSFVFAFRFILLLNILICIKQIITEYYII